MIRVLDCRYGTIPWWPGDSDEVMIGAILTQQTRWENVEQAIEALKRLDLCSIAAIAKTDPAIIENAIRCTGFYRVKTRRLLALARHVEDTYGNVDAMTGVETPVLRDGLLSVKGIGEETADSILCYGFSRESFVIDAYTDRMVRCIKVTAPKGKLKMLFESVLEPDNKVYRMTHAHIVEYAKEYCGKKRCSECILLSSHG
jgi:endonuclease-3 related protein